MLQQYNLITKGDVSSSQEVEGNVYIGGNLSGSTMQVGFVKGDVPDSNLAELVVLGDSTVSYLNLDPTIDVVIGGTSSSKINTPGTVTIGSTPSEQVLDSSYVFSTLDNWSDELASLQTTGTYTEGEQGYTFGAGVYNITLDQLSKHEFTYNLAEGETIVFNVAGENLSIQKNWPGLTSEFSIAKQVVWNFYEAKTLNIDSKIVGSVLAPDATLSGFAGSLEGSVFAYAVNLANGEIHLQQPEIASNDTPVVPVPATLPLLLGGIGAIAALRRRKA